MSRTGALITSTILVLVRLFAVPLAAVAIGAAVWLIFGNWLVPLIAAVVVLLLFVLNMARPRNNVLMARNVAFSHTYLRNQYSRILDSDDLLLLATGMVATTPYLNNGKLSLEDIASAVRHAKENRIFLMGSHRFIYRGIFTSRHLAC